MVSTFPTPPNLIANIELPLLEHYSHGFRQGGPHPSSVLSLWMASVHPSRMGLVPQDSKTHYPDRERYRGRSRSQSRSRSPSRDKSAHRSGGRRASPAYDDYSRRHSPPPPREDPWRQRGNRNPERHRFPPDDRYYGYSGRGADGSNFMDRYVLLNYILCFWRSHRSTQSEKATGSCFDKHLASFTQRTRS